MDTHIPDSGLIHRNRLTFKLLPYTPSINKSNKLCKVTIYAFIPTEVQESA